MEKFIRATAFITGAGLISLFVVGCAAYIDEQDRSFKFKLGKQENSSTPSTASTPSAPSTTSTASTASTPSAPSTTSTASTPSAPSTTGTASTPSAPSNILINEKANTNYINNLTYDLKELLSISLAPLNVNQPVAFS